MTPTATVPVVTLSSQRRRRLVARGQKLNAAREDRDSEIRVAAQEGATLREIADAVGLSFAGVKKIIDRERGKP